MEGQEMKQHIISEIDRRIEILKEHKDDKIITTGNQYEELNQAIAKVINVPLMGELSSIKSYIERL
jgi:hypothetical protein